MCQNRSAYQRERHRLVDTSALCLLVRNERKLQNNGESFFLRYGEVDVVKVLVEEALADLSVA